MLAIISTIQLLEILQLSESQPQQIPFYSLLVSILHIFVMLPMLLFSNKSSKSIVKTKFIKYGKNTEFGIHKNDSNSKDLVLIIKQNLEGNTKKN